MGGCKEAERSSRGGDADGMGWNLGGMSEGVCVPIYLICFISYSSSRGVVEEPIGGGGDSGASLRCSVSYSSRRYSIRPNSFPYRHDDDDEDEPREGEGGRAEPDADAEELEPARCES